MYAPVKRASVCTRAPASPGLSIITLREPERAMRRAFALFLSYESMEQNDGAALSPAAILATHTRRSAQLLHPPYEALADTHRASSSASSFSIHCASPSACLHGDMRPRRTQQSVGLCFFGAWRETLNLVGTGRAPLIVSKLWG